MQWLVEGRAARGRRLFPLELRGEDLNGIFIFICLFVVTVAIIRYDRINLKSPMNEIRQIREVQNLKPRNCRNREILKIEIFNWSLVCHQVPPPSPLILSLPIHP